VANHPNRSKKFGPRDVDLIAAALNSLDILWQHFPFNADTTKATHRRNWANACRALDRLRAERLP